MSFQCRTAAASLFTPRAAPAIRKASASSAARLFGARRPWRRPSAPAAKTYLSVLPLPLLLELICGIVIPVLVGGSVHYDGAAAQSVGVGAPCNIAEAFERTRPTTSVLVPQLLALYAGQLMASGERPPKELRFVAVGGAAVPPALAQAARQLGIPAYEGYGLSECASVVAVNRPGASREGTVGQPLPGLGVAIEDGEIVVQGPTIMDGYLHGDATPRRWRTGDFGSLDADGFLTVYGRLDDLIVTPYGRNLSPEWIETMLLGDPRIGACVLCLAGRSGAADAPSYSVPFGRRLVQRRAGSRDRGGGFPGLRSGAGLCTPAKSGSPFARGSGCAGAVHAERPLAPARRGAEISKGQSSNLRGARMTPFERLYEETAEARERFLAIPLVRQAAASGGTRELYLAFLTEAYHHVKHTFPLLSLAAAPDPRRKLPERAFHLHERGEGPR